MDGKVVIGTELDTKEFDAQIEDLQKKLEMQDPMEEFNKAVKDADEATKGLANDLQSMYEVYKELTQGPVLFESDIEKSKELKQEIIKTINEIERLTGEKIIIKGINDATNDVKKLRNETNKIGSSMQKIAQSVVKWGLAIFGIRSIYNAISQAVSTITSEDAQLSADIEYMRWILAQTIKPVVEWVIKGLYTVIALINMITKSLFNYDLLSGKGAENFKDAKKNTFGVAKNLKEANKQLAGFDEMNVLSDTSSSGGGVSGGLGDWQMPDFPSFEQNIEKLKNKWFEFGNEMEQSLYNMPFSVWTDAFGNWDLAMYGVIQTAHGLWGMITNIFETVGDLWDILHGIITGDTEETEQGFKDLFTDLWEWLKSTVETVTGIDTIIRGVIGALIKIIWGWLIDLVNKGVDKFNEFKDKIINVWTKIREKIRNVVTEIQGWLTEKFGKIGTVLGNAIGGAFKFAVNSALTFIESLLNTPIKAINSLIGTVNKFGLGLKPLQTFKIPKLAKGGIVNMPSRGVPVGGAIAGERGAEGVIPLTDSQQMALLGEAIGKYITINANITNTMNGRIISRELQRVQNDSDFAFNR